MTNHAINLTKPNSSNEPVSATKKRQTFRRLHESGCFVIPNPWDVGSVRYLQSLSFKALATTSSGHAWSHGFADGAIPLGGVLAHLQEIVGASDLPINADLAMALRQTLRALKSMWDWPSKPVWLVCRLKTQRVMRTSRSMTLIPRSAEFALRERRLTKPVATRCWWAARNAFWSAGLIWMKPFFGSSSTPRLAQIACTRRASPPGSK